MAFFRRGQQQQQAPQDLNPESLQGNGLIPSAEMRSGQETAGQGIGQLAGVEVAPVLDTDKVLRASSQYADAWTGVDNIIENAQLSDVLDANDSGVHFEIQDGSGRTVKGRKSSHDVRDALLMTVISARVKAVDRHSEEHSPYIFSYDASEYAEDTEEDRLSLAIFNKMRLIGSTLENEFRAVEGAMLVVSWELTNFIEKNGVDSFVSWLRERSQNETSASLLEMIAQDVHDPRRGKIVEAINGDVESDASPAMISRFSEVLDQQDGDLDKEQEIISFIKATLATNGITKTTEDVLSAQQVEKWPQDLREAFNAFKLARRTDVIVDIRRITEGFYKKNRRLPSIDDLKKIENAKIIHADQRAGAVRTEKTPKRTKVNVSSDYVQPDKSDVRKPKVAQIASAKVIGGTNRELELTVGDPEAVDAQLIAQYVSDYKLDATERLVAVSDIKKMLAALRLDATRNYGVTKLSDIKNFKSANGQQHTVWRLNPAHYNGLSVSKRGKDTRVIYTLSQNGVVGVIGIYSHDDYIKQIKNLR
jgi:hypothetical protein